MKVFIALAALIAVATAFDCFGRNNTCSGSHIKCDTGYDAFCEHMPGPGGRFIGICTCDKACNSASDCSNAGADGCPEFAHPMCDMRNHVCHCWGPAPPPTHETNDSN